MRAAALLALVVLTGPVVGQVYRYTDENGITVLTNIPPERGKYADLENIGCYGTCIKGVDWHATPLKRDPFRDEVRAAAELFGVDEALVRAIMHAESWFNPAAQSHAGAQGLMQLMPATQVRFGVADPFDPVENISGGVAYLAELLRRFENDWELAVAAYNAGEGAVDRYNGVPPFDETREYLRRVRILRARYSS
ncbi:lytic transglycosylase domain-containing protein [Wenzhouxiangella sp. XN79A]|uniref:lytic transglycosylase domain-containing protein n=1 Tax=Wenzhouxiangella sp. XN79A TaxID=2724193 RepID=UPI00144ACF11|nr:lytic transglycosylase domain-containing protein [Wenzhouxiangella sp. XN79A]NKI34095.1 lytic transglycosylase domain-containing protein [Wenzhouxiangella sp. XN79A]